MIPSKDEDLLRRARESEMKDADRPGQREALARAIAGSKISPQKVDELIRRNKP